MMADRKRKASEDLRSLVFSMREKVRAYYLKFFCFIFLRRVLRLPIQTTTCMNANKENKKYNKEK